MRSEMRNLLIKRYGLAIIFIFLIAKIVTFSLNYITEEAVFYFTPDTSAYEKYTSLYEGRYSTEKGEQIENLIKQEKQFTSDASHELRTPISVILAQGEYLLDIAKDEKEKELAQTIVDKSKQVSKLVSRLLLLARIDQNRQKFNKEKVDLGVLVDIAVESVKDMAEQKKIMVFSKVIKPPL